VASIQFAAPPAPAPAAAPAPPIDEARVEAALAAGGKAFEACLAAARKADPKVALEWEWLPVPVTLILGPSGKAIALVIEDAELNRSGLGKCLRREAEALAYPAFSGETARLRTSVWLHDPSANTHNTRRRGL
jgi:hypothetical protein